MHEIGLCESFLGAIERRAAGRRVSAVRLRVGVLHRVVEPALAQAFALVAQGSVAEGATVELVTVPLLVSCDRCGAASEAAGPVPRCPACGAVDPQHSGGDDLVLESIRIAPTASETPGPARAATNRAG